MPSKRHAPSIKNIDLIKGIKTWHIAVDGLLCTRRLIKNIDLI